MRFFAADAPLMPSILRVPRRSRTAQAAMAREQAARRPWGAPWRACSARCQARRAADTPPKRVKTRLRLATATSGAHAKVERLRCTAGWEKVTRPGRGGKHETLQLRSTASALPCGVACSAARRASSAACRGRSSGNGCSRATLLTRRARSLSQPCCSPAQGRRRRPRRLTGPWSRYCGTPMRWCAARCGALFTLLAAVLSACRPIAALASSCAAPDARRPAWRGADRGGGACSAAGGRAAASCGAGAAAACAQCGQGCARGVARHAPRRAARLPGVRLRHPMGRLPLVQPARAVRGPSRSPQRLYCLSIPPGATAGASLPCVHTPRRLCEEHMRADSFSLGGEAQRFCQARGGWAVLAWRAEPSARAAWPFVRCAHAPPTRRSATAATRWRPSRAASARARRSWRRSTPAAARATLLAKLRRPPRARAADQTADPRAHPREQPAPSRLRLQRPLPPRGQTQSSLLLFWALKVKRS